MNFTEDPSSTPEQVQQRAKKFRLNRGLPSLRDAKKIADQKQDLSQTDKAQTPVNTAESSLDPHERKRWRLPKFPILRLGIILTMLGVSGVWASQAVGRAINRYDASVSVLPHSLLEKYGVKFFTAFELSQLQVENEQHRLVTTSPDGTYEIYEVLLPLTPMREQLRKRWDDLQNMFSGKQARGERVPDDNMIPILVVYNTLEKRNVTALELDDFLDVYDDRIFFSPDGTKILYQYFYSYVWIDAQTGLALTFNEQNLMDKAHPGGGFGMFVNKVGFGNNEGTVIRIEVTNGQTGKQDPPVDYDLSQDIILSLR